MANDQHLIHRLKISEAPPTVNKMWRAIVRGNRAVNILSEVGRIWKAVAIQELQRQNQGFSGPCYWRTDILIPGSSNVDLDNHLKGVLDVLHESGKTPDDRYLVDLRIRFHQGDQVIVAIRKEEASKWAIIRKASRSLTKKLAKNSF